MDLVYAGVTSRIPADHHIHQAWAGVHTANPGTIRRRRAILPSSKSHFSRSILMDLVYAGVINRAI